MSTLLREHPVLGKVEPDPVGTALGTGYDRFDSWHGVCGLAKFTDDRLDVLAVVSAQPGCGCFREFIVRAKREFKTICIWEVWNDALPEILERYGFVRVSEEQNMEMVEGYRWDAR